MEMKATPVIKEGWNLQEKASECDCRDGMVAQNNTSLGFLQPAEKSVCSNSAVISSSQPY